MATEIHFEPTLNIFAGTSPAQVAWRYRRLFESVYGRVPVIRYLWIDSDATVDPEIAPWFSPEERVELTGFNADEVLENVDAYPAIKAWWPRESRLRPGYVSKGAKQIRLAGRLAFFRMFNDRSAGPALIDKLTAQIAAMWQIQNIDATERMSTEQLRYVVERNSTRVNVWHSDGGGQGSAICWDLGYLSRSLLRTHHPTVVSFSWLPPVVDAAIKNESQVQREKIRANTYAWFREGGMLAAVPEWHVQYPEGAPVSMQRPPFDIQFVLDLGNQAGYRLNSEDDIYEMLAQAAFLDTGSPVAGALRGFTANVSVLNDEFQGRRRMYSSLAAASLIFPAKRIAHYCGARLGQAAIQMGLLATPTDQATAESASALIGRLGLRDATVLEHLLQDRRVSCDSGPAIRKAEKVEMALGLLDAQETHDRQERARQVARIEETGERLLSSTRRSLAEETTALTLQSGAPAAQAVLWELAADVRDTGEAIADTALSLKALKARLAQQGGSEADLNYAEEEYRKARKTLRALEGGFFKTARKNLRHGSWQQDFDRARNDCLHWLNETNKLTLQLAGQRVAANLYDQALTSAAELQAALARVVQAAGRAAEDLRAVADADLKPATAQQGIYEGALEVVGADYFRAYYARHGAGLDPHVIYQATVQGLRPADLADLEGWTEANLAAAAERHAGACFGEALENTSLLEALTEYHGAAAPTVIEAQFDRLVRYAHPFWQYNSDAGSGVQSQEGKSIIGVEDETSELIPARYRDNIQYEVKSTGLRHRVDLARVQHGLPAFLLSGMDDYKACYEARRKGLDPLHVLPEAVMAEDVMPEEKAEERGTFAIAAAFGYVVQIGTYYYFDPTKEYARSSIHPGRDYRLANGREKAEDEFVQHDDWVKQVDDMVEDEIESMGNRAAIALLDARIAEQKEAIAKMPVDSDLRRQYESEIRALQAKQRQLGRLGQELPLAA